MSSLPVCENCLKPGDKLAGSAKGKLTTYAGVECYVTGDSQTNAIVYSTDVWGHTFPSHQLNADAYAAGGFTVIVPKTLNDNMDFTDPTALNRFMEWLERNPTSHASSVVGQTLDQALKDYKSVQLVGFCYGARMVIDQVERNCGIKAAVLYHPTFLKEEDAAMLARVGTPLRFNCAEQDSLFASDLRAKFEVALKGKTAVFQEYPGTEHGFGARPHGEQAQKAREEALQDTIAYLKQNAAA